MSFLEFVAGRWSEILTLTLEHVVLVVISIVAGVLIAVPLGLAITRIPALSRPVLGFAGVIQTVPSLALFGLLIPLPFIGGIGSRTAIIALVLYALLPILRNTVTGVRQVDPAILDAANGMGMTDWQRLTLVEVPLALPSIFSGIRIATVVGVGLVTIAAAVGAGGLGSLIFRGLAMLDSRLLFAGAIPSAILALIADGGLALLESRLVASRGARLRDPSSLRERNHPAPQFPSAARGNGRPAGARTPRNAVRSRGAVGGARSEDVFGTDHPRRTAVAISPGGGAGGYRAVPDADVRPSHSNRQRGSRLLHRIHRNVLFRDHARDLRRRADRRGDLPAGEGSLPGAL